MEELPPGFRFYPLEEELVTFYLPNQLNGRRQEMHRVVPVVDIYAKEPWQLPECSGDLCQGDTEQWFFFVPRREREARGGRPTRTTASGYWKATGSPGYVYSLDNRVIGVKKTMVFYKGKAPTGRKTKWKMNEYRAIEEVANNSGTNIPKLRHEFSLCRVYVVSGSSRAFDRRPVEAMAGLQHNENIAETTSQNIVMVEKSSSPETSNSGHPPETSRSTNMEMNDVQEQSLSEWEQLDWF